MSFNLRPSKYAFQALPGYFVYTNPANVNESLPAIAPNFGLENGMTWAKLQADLKSLNAQSHTTRKSYKLVYAARHGEGWHNVAEAKYGTKAWDDHWSLLTTDGESEKPWGPDPELTEVGRQQARDARAIWQDLLKTKDEPPLPMLYFSSPMQRAAETLHLTFGEIAWPSQHGEQTASHGSDVRPHILECIREDFSTRHTCDERDKASFVAARWQPFGWRIDEQMPEDDEIFASKTLVESKQGISKRIQDALSVIWDLCSATESHSGGGGSGSVKSSADVINITSHSGAMQALFRACNHPDFKPKTGGMVPMLIEATLL